MILYKEGSIRYVSADFCALTLDFFTPKIAICMVRKKFFFENLS